MKYLFLILLLPFSLHGQACRQLEQMTGQTIGCGHSSNTETQTNYYTPTQAEYNASFTKEYKRLALDENEKGLKKLRAGDYKAAERLFKSALDYDKDNQGIKENLKLAQQNISYQQQTKPQEHELKPQEKAFLLDHETNKKGYKSQLERIYSRLESYVPPLTNNWYKRTLKDGLMMGFGNEKKDYEKEPSINPFTGENYALNQVFAGTDNNNSFKESFRVIRDNLTIGDYTLSTEHGKKLMAELQGTVFNRMVAHSNGATVTEALIRKGVIKVEELHIIGGDRSMANYEGYDELIKKYGVKKIVIWNNPKDPIPLGTSVVNKMDPTYKNLVNSFINHTWNGRLSNQIQYKELKTEECSNESWCISAHFRVNYAKGMFKSLQNSNPRNR